LEENGNPGVVQTRPDAPRGVFKVSVDDKGRLKLPAAMLEYLQALGEIKVFITTLDLKEVRIYPLSAWKEVEKWLEEPGPNAAARRDLAWVAANYGKDDELDAQGRLTLPGDLRKEMSLEKDETRARWSKGHLKLVSSRQHEVVMTAAKTDLDAKNLIALDGGL
jgi:MraZ protein